MASLAKAWGLNYHLLHHRLANGWDIKAALTTQTQGPMGNATPSRDHLGRDFPTLKAMAKAWNISAQAVARRLDRGWTIEKALTTPTRNKGKRQACKDHLGREYPSLSAMATAWNIHYGTLCGRLSKGWTVKRALTASTQHTGRRCKESLDHLGRVFPSFKVMCEAWDKEPGNVATMLHRGKSLKHALTCKRKHKR